MAASGVSRSYTLYDTCGRLYDQWKKATGNADAAARSAAQQVSGGVTLLAKLNGESKNSRMVARALGIGIGVYAIYVCSMQENDDDGVIFWSRDFETFSISAAKPKPITMIQSQVESGNQSAFVGIYENLSCRTDAAFYTANNMFRNVVENSRQNERRMSEQIIRQAYSRTSDGFWLESGSTSVWGCTCLMAILWERTLYVANAGDSRGVLGIRNEGDEVTAVQVNHIHDADGFRQLANGKRKDYSRRSAVLIGEAFVKDQVFQKEPPLDIVELELTPKHEFIILASHGLWKLLTIYEAVEIVHTHPNREGIARRLVGIAVERADARPNREIRPRFVKDISVVVVFFDNNAEVIEVGNGVSIRGFSDAVGPRHPDFGPLVR